jgi:SAM-dependent methyltransferase
MNAQVRHLTLESPVLDAGAGRFGTSSYHRVIPCFSSLNVYSIDLRAGIEPHCLANIERGLPFKSGTFRTVLALNVLNFFFDFSGSLVEFHRVLKPGGKLCIWVPFLMRITLDPVDNFRFTQPALERALKEAGFREQQIEPHGGGAVTAALAQIDFAVPAVGRPFALLLALKLDRLVTRRSGGRYRNENDYPLAYFVTAIKA